MNAMVPQRYIDQHVAEDPARAAAEYGAQFRVDIDSFVSREVIDAAVVVARRELPPIDGVHYTAFCDPSGGSADSMTLAICHVEGGNRAVLDVIRERKPPFSPDDVAKEFANVLKSYNIAAIRGDRYGGEWPRERFRVHNIEYIPAAKPKSDLYASRASLKTNKLCGETASLLPVLNGGRAELLDHPLAATLLIMHWGS